MQRVLPIVIAAGLTACGSSSGPICEQAEYDVCTSCARDQDCATASARGEVCAGDMQCWPPSVLRTVTLSWTIGGQPANTTTCANLPSELNVSFDNSVGLMPDGIEPPPVPCTAGLLVQGEVPPDLATIAILAGDHLLGKTGSDRPTIDLPSSLDGFACTGDQDCASDVCSIVERCQPATKVETLHVTWTVNSQPASTTSCATLPNITIVLSDSDPADDYDATVQCADGMFSASKVPTYFTTVTMYDDASQQSLGTATLADGAATLDLMPM